ncbi:MAG: hypothetical protein EOO89_31465 [Pedobacter sp.]|nr:MAG: hypothetical protein EOO89_31465 [Pedobacter sp.]
MKNRGLRDKLVPFICVLSPGICWFLNANSTTLLGGYKFSVELILVNGLITLLGLFIISKPTTAQTRF